MFIVINEISLTGFFLYKYLASTSYNYTWVRIRGRHETRGSDGVPGWILCVGNLVRRNGCSSVAFGFLGCFFFGFAGFVAFWTFAWFTSGGPGCGADI